MTALWYHLRLQVNAGTAAVLFLPVVATIFTNTRSGPLSFAELLWPLAAPVLMAALFSREWEAGTAEPLLARPVARWRLLAGRVLVAVALLFLTCLAGWVTYLVAGHGVGLWSLLRAVGPGALALGAVSLLVGTATRNSAAGYLVPLAWWMLDWLTGGGYTGRFYLLSTEKSWLLWLAGAALLGTWGALIRRDR